MRWLKYFFLFLIIGAEALVSSCSHEDEVRMPADILGVWSPDRKTYLVFSNDNLVHRLQIEQQEASDFGLWSTEVYYYEPGYNLVIYLSAQHDADVYQITELSDTRLEWCWVYKIEARNTEEIGKIIGEIINKAQEGFTLNPELYQSFNKIPEDTFLDILDNLGLQYPV